MRTRTAKNELQSQLFAWGAWLRSRPNLVKELIPPAYANVLARFIPSESGPERNTRLNADSQLLHALIMGMYNDGGCYRVRAVCMVMWYALSLKEEAAAIEMNITRRAFQWSRNRAEENLEHRRGLFVAAQQKIAMMQELVAVD